MNKKFKENHWLIGDRLLYFYVNYYGCIAWQEANYPLRIIFYSKKSNGYAYVDESDPRPFHRVWQKTISNPGWIDGILREFKKSRKSLIRTFTSTNYKELDNDKLFELFSNDFMDFYMMYQRDGNTVARALDRYGIDVLRKQLSQSGVDEVEHTLTALTVSHIESYLAREERLFWRGVINKKSKTMLDKFLNGHLKRFAYVTRSYFNESALRTSDLKHRLQKHPKAEWLELSQAGPRALRGNIKAYQKAINDKRITANIKKSARALRQAAHIKDYIRECFAEVTYFADPLYKELSRRTKLSIPNLKCMLIEEIHIALYKVKKPPKKLLRERLRGHYVTIPYRGGVKVLYGQQAKKYHDKHLQANLVESQNDIMGRPVSPGVVRGKVRIALDVKEARKLRQGEVLVVSNTNPGYVPFLKGIAAIIAEEGGVTVHAAIVSREMHIPCVIGIPRAKELFKDGELVEVNADEGVVRKL